MKHDFWMSENIKLLIVDDYPVVLSGLVAMFKNHDDIELVGVANNGKKAVELALKLRPNVVLMNLIMPEMDGVETTRIIKKSVPEVNIIIFSGVSTYEAIIPAINVGAIGYLQKDASEPELVEAVRKVARGEVHLPPAIIQYVIKLMHGAEEQEDLIKKLTDRELDVLKLMAKGYTNQEIAKFMVVSAATVHSHVSHILSKLDVSSRTLAVIYAMRSGIIDPLDGKD